MHELAIATSLPNFRTETARESYMHVWMHIYLHGLYSLPYTAVYAYNHNCLGRVFSNPPANAQCCKTKINSPWSIEGSNLDAWM